ncbi:MAG: ankyrin repeat domain-containing protein, partial [Allorhizobium sp.]
ANPNAKYITHLLDMVGDPALEDAQGRQPIHMAAACSGTGPLKALLERTSAVCAARDGKTPLMAAAETGRVHNVALMLVDAAPDELPLPARQAFAQLLPGMVALPAADDGVPAGAAAADAAAAAAAAGGPAPAAAMDEDEEGGDAEADEDAGAGPAGSGGRPRARQANLLQRLLTAVDKQKRSALHYAAHAGHVEVIRALHLAGANPEAVDSARCTPLMLAAQAGQLAAVDAL